MALDVEILTGIYRDEVVFASISFSEGQGFGLVIDHDWNNPDAPAAAIFDHQSIRDRKRLNLHTGWISSVSTLEKILLEYGVGIPLEARRRLELRLPAEVVDSPPVLLAA